MFRADGSLNPLCMIIKNRPSSVSPHSACTQIAFDNGSRGMVFGDPESPEFCCTFPGPYFGPVLPTWASQGSYVGNVTDYSDTCALYHVKAATPNAYDTISIKYDGSNHLCGIGNTSGNNTLAVMLLDLEDYSSDPVDPSVIAMPTACGTHVPVCQLPSNYLAQ